MLAGQMTAEGERGMVAVAGPAAMRAAASAATPSAAASAQGHQLVESEALDGVLPDTAAAGVERGNVDQPRRVAERTEHPVEGTAAATAATATAASAVKREVDATSRDSNGIAGSSTTTARAAMEQGALSAALSAAPSAAVKATPVDAKPSGEIRRDAKREQEQGDKLPPATVNKLPSAESLLPAVPASERAAYARLLRARDELSSSAPWADALTVMYQLNALAKEKVTEQMLSDSQVGRVVNRVARKHPDRDVVKMAEGIKAKWILALKSMRAPSAPDPKPPRAADPRDPKPPSQKQQGTKPQPSKPEGSGPKSAIPDASKPARPTRADDASSELSYGDQMALSAAQASGVSKRFFVGQEVRRTEHLPRQSSACCPCRAEMGGRAAFGVRRWFGLGFDWGSVRLGQG